MWSAKKRAEADAEGHVVFKMVPPGTHELTVCHEGPGAACGAWRSSAGVNARDVELK